MKLYFLAGLMVLSAAADAAESYCHTPWSSIALNDISAIYKLHVTKTSKGFSFQICPDNGPCEGLMSLRSAEWFALVDQIEEEQCGLQAEMMLGPSLGALIAVGVLGRAGVYFPRLKALVNRRFALTTLCAGVVGAGAFALQDKVFANGLNYVPAPVHRLQEISAALNDASIGDTRIFSVLSDDVQFWIWLSRQNPN